jgi:hypothetical protein
MKSGSVLMLLVAVLLAALSWFEQQARDRAELDRVQELRRKQFQMRPDYGPPPDMHWRMP